LDAAVADGVRGDGPPGLVRLLDGGLELLGLEGGLARVHAGREHATGGHDLDEVGAALDLRADRLAYLVRPVGLAPDEVPVAACHGDHSAGGADAWALDQAPVDRLRDLQRDLA